MNLTKPQQLIYEMEKFSGGTISVICGSMLLNGNKNPQEITTAINELYKINDALRIRISETNGNVQQTVSEYTEQDFEVLNFNSKDELDIYAQSYAMKPLDLYGSLCEFKVVVLPDKYGCLVKLHHMIGDAWTLALLGTKLNSILNGETVQAYSYADYIESEKKYLDGKRYEKDITFFLEQFKKCDEPTLLNEKNIDSLKSVRKTFVIEKDKAEAIKKYCSDNNSSPFMLFMSTLAIYMNRIKMNQEKFYIGTAVLNRSGAKERNTAGMFINTVPLLIELDNTKSFSENISAFENSVMSVFRHQKFNYGDILKSIRQEYNFTEKLYDVMLSYQNAVITGNEIESTWYHSGMQSESLQIHIDDRDNENIYRIHYDYQTDKFSENDIFAMHSHICKLLFDAINNGGKKIYELEMLSDEEYQKVIFDFNDTAVDYPREKCIHELFEEQARKNPDKIALVFEDKKFTYKQLDEMSNSLAHYLREEKNIQPNDIVPIIAKRSWHIIVAMLGILKAGGAYMPVSTELPAERIKHMLAETKSRFVLIYDIQPDVAIEAIDLNIIDYNKNTHAVDNINSANDLCYVLFTSGSTGKPKAVMISHKNLVNFTDSNNNNNSYQCNMLHNCDTVLAVTTFSFDISVFEIYLSLVNGLKIVLSNEKENLSAESLAKLIVENDVDVVHSTPTKFLAFLNNEEFQKAAKQLKMLMIGAEVFTDEIYNTISKYTDATIYNGYGPTETTIGVTFKRINNIHPCIHELFEEQARKTPDKIALVFEDKQFTYKQLDEMSDSLAHYLREEKNIQPNDIIPIIAKRSWHIIVAMLGVLKAGGAYMPVDPTYPMDRVSFMIEEAKSKIALTFGYEGKLETDTISLETFNYSNNIKSIENLNTSSDLCYLIFTSGSTGKPKAVMISHLNVSNYTNDNEINVVHRIIKKSYKSILSVTNIVFDIFVTESILSLLNGITIYFTNDEEILLQEKLAVLINNNDIDVMQTTPTKMRGYMHAKNNLNYLKKLKTIILGGETLPTDLYEELSQYTNAKIYNIYGPAETTVWSTNSHVESIDITIGKPIANTQIYILDKNRKPLPIGVAGELCISGDGVGKGYLNRPELTAEKFIQNPFYDERTNPTAGKIMYCTGDLARWRADGEIEYLGRIDTQVKIRGLRIELGEIESVMSTFDGINMTAVTDKRDENNRQYLVGYYTAEKAIDEKSLRQHLSAKLPKYMVPNYFVHLSEMPMTASGKTDRKNLPLPDFTVSQEEYVAPETKTEIKLSQLWGKLLKLENVGKNDDFYELGGDSLMAITLLSHIENEFNVNVTMKDILENSVLENLAKCIENSDKKTAEITSTGVNKYALLPQQKAIYAVCSKNPDTLTYNMPTRIPLNESIDREKIKACFEKIIQKHSSLRTYISAETDNIFGIVNDTAELVFEEYSDENYMDFMRPFDLSQAPLMRIGFTETSMLFDMHHIIADGESLNIILSDLAKLYFDETATVNKIRYADYAEYFKNVDFSEHKAFYKDMLKCDFEPIILPEKKNQTQSEGVSKIYSISKNDFENAKKYAQKNGLTDTMLFLGAFGILLSKYTAKSEVLTSVVLTNRTHRETQDIVGMFVNTLPIFMNAVGETETYYAEIKDTLLNMFEYQELPFTEIAEAVGMTDKSVVNTSFVYQADGEKKLSIDGIELAPEFIDTHTSKFDITFEMTPNENGYAVRIEYNSGKYEESLIDKLFKAYTMILEQLKKENISDIFVLDDEEYQKVIFDFNDTAVDYPREKCIHELFEEQARKNPDKIAIIACNNTLTYSQLNEQANKIAHSLIKNGIGVGDIVAFALRRKSYLIAVMLGILKSGAAYLPIDPDYPKDRIDYMLSDSNAKYFITEDNVLDLLDNNNIENPDVKISSEETCYCIYTSGSTGKPKGVTIAHKNIHNFICDNSDFQKSFINNCEYVIGINAVCFDITVQEIHLPLLNGKTVIFISDDEITDSSKISEHFKEKTALIITPTKLSYYMKNKNFLENMKCCSLIMSGAETFSSSLYEELRKYTSAEIYNGYGPTETTCGSLYSKVFDINNITIGKPIANTQIYILDKNRKPLPIGVAGELCISGDGVGKGYLNRPELTAEKFISNPFYDEKANPTAGKIMYCTGDLARWRADGEIEYLGRIDTQVKIRGLRIELGEIESVMSTFDGINMTAVTDKRDENNRQYLVGYYTAETEIDEKSLRQHLSSKLPKYMVPNYFVHLSDMPMTASGKTDRKNLPLPDFTVSQEEYVAPETETEIKLCNLLSQLFEVEKVGVTDDFFDIGGDSLRAIEYVAKAHNEGIYFNLQNVFDYPTVRELCECIENGDGDKISFADYDFSKISAILEKNKTENITKPEKTEVGNLLLAGATGYLGIHILADFLEKDTGTAYCLVRGKNTDDSKKRLNELLEFYFGDKYLNNNRIEVICADLQKENFGLSDDEYEKLICSVNTVVNSAASVKHYGSYKYFYEANVETTKRLIKFCKESNVKLIHTSTLSVSGNSFADEFDGYVSETVKHFSECSLYIGQPLDNVYSRSKFEAEKEVLEAMAEGLQANIMRMGNLTNRFSDGIFQKNYESNAFLQRVRSVLQLGMIPDYLMDLYAEFTPIDEAANAVMTITRSFDSQQTVFHINSTKVVYMDKFYEYLTKLGIEIQIVSGEMFGETLRQTAKLSGMEHIFETFINDMDENEKLNYDSNIRIENEFTVEYLKKLGFEWNDIDFEYLKKYIEYFRNIGYLEV